MDQIHVVRHKVLAEGRSIRAVSRETGIHRTTIRRYLRDPVPRRVESGPRRRPVRERVEARVREVVDEWRGRTTRKQRLTGKRLHRQLREEGHEVGITTVRSVLREIRREEAEVFVPLVRRPGEEAQVDFFEVVVCVDGVTMKAWMLLMRLLFSGRDFARIYERQDQIAFLDAHVRAFEHFGALPTRITYDNTKLAVKRVTRKGRDLSVRFEALAAHYAFEPCFTRVGEGHDKGSVESRGRSVRWQHLVPVPAAKTLEDINARLLADLDQQAAGGDVLARFEQERAYLVELPGVAFEARRVVPVEVRSNATVRIEGAWYSVPSAWARTDALAKVGVDAVEITRGAGRVTHVRVRSGQKSVRYRHYLSELAKKPQAVRQVAPELVAELGPPYDRLWTLLTQSHGEREGGRVLAKVLGAVCRHGEEPVREALEQALAGERLDLLALGALTARPRPAEVAVPATLAGHSVESAAATDYDWLHAAQEVVA
jgi:transposase